VANYFCATYISNAQYTMCQRLSDERRGCYLTIIEYAGLFKLKFIFNAKYYPSKPRWDGGKHE